MEIIKSLANIKDLPTGIDDFNVMRQENYYYVDKTLHVRELGVGKVSLFETVYIYGVAFNKKLSMVRMATHTETTDIE